MTELGLEPRCWHARPAFNSIDNPEHNTCSVASLWKAQFTEHHTHPVVQVVVGKGAEPQMFTNWVTRTEAGGNWNRCREAQNFGSYGLWQLRPSTSGWETGGQR